MRPDLDRLFIRYFLGALSPTDRRALDEWLEESATNRQELDRLEAIWRASAEHQDAGPEPQQVESALLRVKARTRQGTLVRALPTRPHASVASPGASRIGRVARIAAAILIVAGGVALWRWQNAPEPAPIASTPAHVYATAKGERAKITLADGSVVQLGVESALDIPPEFGKAGRELSLRGEAYFEVAHDTTRPFRVRANGALTEVLGTKFDIRARDREVLRVTVADGRVAVAAERSGPASAVSRVVLGRGDQAQMSADGEMTVRHGADVSRALSWIDGRLVFDQALLRDVLVELSRWYDREFVLRDPALASVRLTTQLRGTSLAEAVAVLETALDATIAVTERTVVIERRREAQHQSAPPAERRRP